MGRGKILYDPQWKVATVQGEDGFTQVEMSRTEAQAICNVLKIPFIICKPGTSVPADG